MKFLVKILICVVLLTSVADAHEIFNISGSGIPLYWTTGNLNSTGAPGLKVYKNFVSSENSYYYYENYYSDAVSKWNNISYGTVTVTTTFVPLDSLSNVALYNSSYVWDAYGCNNNALACTLVKDTNNNILRTPSQANNSTKLIKYATICLNPDISVFTSGLSTADPTYATKLMNRIKKTITHEVGHALLLGHPDVYSTIPSNVSSVMRQGYPDSSTNISLTPTLHEKSDIRGKYQYHNTL